jgi:hypothetical protein
MRTTLLIVALVLANLAHADDECRGHSCNDSGGDIDINIEGSPVDLQANPTTNVTGSTYSSRALAIGNGLGDVDINDCLGSEQFGTPLYSRQWLELNKWCAAEVFDAKGLNVMAGMLRCEIKEIRKLFDNDTACLDANTIFAAPAASMPELEPVVATLASRIDEFDEDEEQHEQQITQTALDLAELKRSIDNERAARKRYAANQRDQADAEALERNAFLDQYKELTQQTEETPRD